MIHIGILTYFSSINYGAFLQSYAFQNCLMCRYQGIVDVEIINYNSKRAQEMYLDRIIYQGGKSRDKLLGQYNSFIQSRKRLKIGETELITDDIEQLRNELLGKYDIIIAGSDEIWKTNSVRGFPNGYWLNFDLEKTVYMAYAVSGRNNYQEMSQDMQAYIRSAMKRFTYIGTRDEITRQELLKVEKVEIERNCDPTFLNPQLFFVSDEEKRKVRQKYGLILEKPLITIMINNKEVGSILYRMFRNDNQIVYLYNINERVEKYNLAELSPFEWSKVISISDLVITEFFHGTIFSILHGVPFVAIENSEKGRGKIENLLYENDMVDKFLYQADYTRNNKQLAMDLYTKGRKEMRDYNLSNAKEVVTRERQKAEGFFEKLEQIMGDFCDLEE